MPENSSNNDDIKDKAVSSPPKSPVNKKSNRKAKSGKSSPSKHKYDVHYHDWEDEEIANLMATVAEAPGDLGHKAKWRWIAKNMITERVFTYHDCHHAYSSHQHHLQTMKEAEISKQEEEEKEKKRLEDEAARLKLKQKNWNLAYHKRCLKWIENEKGYLSFPKWNFYKYLFDRKGNLIAWFSSVTKPNSKKFINEVEKIIK